MVYVYLSDESITVAKSNEAPRVGEHLGPWLPVIQEIARFRKVTENNQIALPIAITDVLSLGATLTHLQENTPTNLQTHRILDSVVEQLDTAIYVDIPPPPDEEPVTEVEMDFADAELRIAADAASRGKESISMSESEYDAAERSMAARHREAITLASDDVAEISASDLLGDDE